MSKRLAVCFGLNYTGTKDELSGCVNDATMMRGILTQNGYATYMCTTNATTTKRSMESVLYNMAMSTWSDPTITSVWIYYAGHGTQIRDVDNDESDGLDEAIVPSDCRTSGVISDDQIYRILQSFNPTCVVSLFLDCCHSGSICDLPYSYQTNGSTMLNVKMETKKKALRGKVRILSACLDSQKADEITINRKVQGMATTTLNAIVMQTPNPTWMQIRQSFDHTLRNVGVATQRGVISSSTLLTNDERLF